MKEALNAMVQAIGDQAIALGAVADRLTALKQALAHQFPGMADDLKTQVEAEQEKSRTENYNLQVSIAKLREAIAQLPESAPESPPAAAGEAQPRSRKASAKSAKQPPRRPKAL